MTPLRTLLAAAIMSTGALPALAQTAPDTAAAPSPSASAPAPDAAQMPDATAPAAPAKAHTVKKSPHKHHHAAPKISAPQVRG